MSRLRIVKWSLLAADFNYYLVYSSSTSVSHRRRFVLENGSIIKLQGPPSHDGEDDVADLVHGFPGRVLRLSHREHSAINDASETYPWRFWMGEQLLGSGTAVAELLVRDVQLGDHDRAPITDSQPKVEVILKTTHLPPSHYWKEGKVLDHLVLGGIVTGMPKVHSYGVVWQQLHLIPHLDEMHDRFCKGTLTAARFNEICSAFGVLVSGKWWTSISSLGNVGFVATLTEDNGSSEDISTANCVQVRTARAASLALSSSVRGAILTNVPQMPFDSASCDTCRHFSCSVHGCQTPQHPAPRYLRCQSLFPGPLQSSLEKAYLLADQVFFVAPIDKFHAILRATYV